MLLKYPYTILIGNDQGPNLKKPCGCSMNKKQLVFITVKEMVIAGGIKNFSNSDPSVFHLCSYVDVLLWMGVCNCQLRGNGEIPV